MALRRKNLQQKTLRQAVAVVAAVASLSLLAACGEDEKPELKRTPASETPSVSESPSASQTPEPKRESAKAFIRRWQKTEDKMQNTGDTSEYRKLNTRLCDSCKSLADRVDKIYKAGGHIEFAGSEILSLTREGGAENMPEFEMELKIPRTTFAERSGAKTQELPSGTAKVLVILKRRGDTWKVNNSLLKAG